MTELAGSGRKLRLWEAVAVSVGFMAPVLAMALNGIGIAALVGKAVPLVFVVAFVGVGLVAYGFVRLTAHFNHAGSLYGLAGATIGPRAGFFGGFALLGTYLFFAACTLAACGVFYDAWVDQLGVEALRLPWIVVALACAVVVALLNLRESRVTARILFVIGAVGIVLMLVLAVTIVVKVLTGSPDAPAGQTLDPSVFSFDSTTLGAVMTASVFAFLSWAGFESCASLGEETDNPRRAIPLSLIGAVAACGVLYVVMMFAQTIGFGTDAAGVEAFAGASSSLTDLASKYLGAGFSVLLAFSAFVVAFASTLSSTAAASRLVFALARDGFGPKALATVNTKTGAPGVAVLTTVGIAGLLAVALALFGIGAFDVYYWYATIAVLCMLVAYAVASIGVIRFTLSGRGHIPRWELIVPLLGIGYLVFVFIQQSLGQEPPYSWFPWIAGAWCLLGLVVVLVRPELANRIGARLTDELVATGADESEIDRKTSGE
jgi:amino acid transporter